MERRESLSSDDGDNSLHTPKSLSNGHSGNLSHQINLKKLAENRSSRVSFSSTPDKVFETYSKVEYERKDSDSNPLSASLVFEMEKIAANLDRHEITLTKGAEGLGFSISGMGFGENLGPDDKLSIYVKEIISSGVAGKDGRMRTGDQIIDVNGSSMVGITYREAVAILRGASGQVRLVLGRRPSEDRSNGSPEQRRLVHAGLATSPTDDRSANGRLEINKQLRSIGGSNRTLRRMDTPKQDSSSSDEDEKNRPKNDENHKNDLEKKLLIIKESHSRDLSLVNDFRLKESRYENEKRELMKRMSDTDQKYEKRIRELTQKLNHLEILYQAKFGGKATNSKTATTHSHKLISIHSHSNGDQTDGIKKREKDSSDSESDDEKRKLTAPLPVIPASSTAHAPMLKTHSREVSIHGSVDNHTISGKKHSDSSDSEIVPPNYAPPPIPNNDVNISLGRRAPEVQQGLGMNGSLARRTSKDGHGNSSESDREDPSKTIRHHIATSIATKSEERTKDSSSDDDDRKKTPEIGKSLSRTETFEISGQRRSRRSSSDDGENRGIGAGLSVNDVLKKPTHKSHGSSASSDEDGTSSKTRMVEHGDRLDVGGSLIVERVQRRAGESSDNDDENVKRAINASIAASLVRQESFKVSERLVDGGERSSSDDDDDDGQHKSRKATPHGGADNKDGLIRRDGSGESDSSGHREQSQRSGGEVKSKKKSGGIFGRRKKKENNISHDSTDDDDDDDGDGDGDDKTKKSGKGKKKKAKKNKNKQGEHSHSDDSSEDEDNAKGKKKKLKGKAEKKSKTRIKRTSIDSSNDAAIAGAMAAAIGMEYHRETTAPVSGVQIHQSSASILPIPTISEAEFTSMERVRRESHRSSGRISNASLSSSNSTSKVARRLAAHGHRDSSDSGDENRRKTWKGSLEVDEILGTSIRPWSSTPNIGASSGLVVSSGRNDIGEADRWTKQEVITWLITVNLVELTDVFERHDIDGRKLFAMTSKSYKEMNITGKNQDILKKQIKELQKSAARERKRRTADARKREKEFKEQEKLRKKEQKKIRTLSASSIDESENEEHGKEKNKKKMKIGRHKDTNMHAGDHSHSDDSSDEDNAKSKKKKSKGKTEKKSKTRIKRTSIGSSNDAAIAGAMAAAIGMEYHRETTAPSAGAGVQVHQSSTSIVQIPVISQAEFDSMGRVKRESHRSSERMSKVSLSSADSVSKVVRRAMDHGDHHQHEDSSDSDDENRRKIARSSFEVDAILESSIRPWSSTPNIGASGGLVVSFGHERQSSGQNDFREADRWTKQEVITWLATINLMELTDIFERHDVDGRKLFAMTSKSYKEMNITGKNRDILKKQIKELQKAVDKERKLKTAETKKREKEFKEQEKLRKKEQKKNRGALSHDESENEEHGKEKKKKKMKIGRHQDTNLHAGDHSHSDDSSDEDNAKSKKKKSKGKTEKKSKTRIKRTSIDSSNDAAIAGAMAAAIGMEYHRETTAPSAGAGVQVHQSSTSIVQIPVISQAEFDAMGRDSIRRDADERSIASRSSADSVTRGIRHSVAESSEGVNRLQSWTSAIEVANSVETGLRPWSSTSDVSAGTGLFVSSGHVRSSSGRNDFGEADLWTKQEVITWLVTIHLAQLIYTFERHGIDGSKLLAMTNNSFKEMEIAGKDKDLLKKNIKVLVQAVTKARKLREKEEKRREKAQKAQAKLSKKEAARKVSASSG